MGTSVNMANCKDCENKNGYESFGIVLEWRSREKALDAIELARCPKCGGRNWLLHRRDGAMMSERADRSEVVSGGLLPCPFCGSDDLRVCEHGIECRNCGVWMGDGTQCRTIGTSVIDAWNKRANTGLHRTEPAAGSGTVRGLVGHSGISE